MIGLSDMNVGGIKPLKKTYSIGSKNITFETGKLGLLANGSVTISDDLGNMLLVTAGVKEEGINENADFFPLVVDYQEKFYATGKIGGNRFMKREGRPSETSVLTSRLIDRPIRPMFKKGFVNDTQIIATVLSSSNENDLGFLGITGASLALLITGTPFEGPVSGVKIILDENGNYIFDPSFENEENAKLNLLVAGTLDAITMVESTGKEVSKEEMMNALKYAFGIIKEFSKAQKDFIKNYKKEFGIPEIKAYYKLPDKSVFDKISSYLTDDKLEKLYGLGKKDFQKTVLSLEEEICECFGITKENEKEIGIKISDISISVEKNIKNFMRKNVLENEKRLDLRKLDEVRKIKCETGLLPRVHGSGLFQRGLTQVLSTTTLGGPEDIQIIDDMYEETSKRFMHHYNFPPFSVGEVRFLRAPSRRDIGHGKLAEKAIEGVIPSERDFPYVIRVVSETMTCNGSSSMASICGTTLSLMQAGVPISSPVAGIAMGMIYDEKNGKYKILTDIQAQEDFLGDMDFKVAMTKKGITAMQLDVKISGLSLEVFSKAFSQARVGIDHILDEMLKVQPTVSKELSPYAPLIMDMQVPIDKIREVIGKGGENVQRIENENNVKILISEDGLTTITAKDQKGGNDAIEKIKKMIWEPEIGYIGNGKIIKILEGVGVIVEFAGGKVGMIHISKLSPNRIAKIEGVVKIGDSIEFEIIDINKEKGRIGLKRIFK